MRLSFIVTPGARGLTAGDLAALSAAALPGDEVIIVATRAMAPARLAGQPHFGAGAARGGARPDAVVWRAMRLGAVPPPSGAVAANAGLAMASGEAVVFLARGARPEPAGMQAARALLARSGADLVVGRFNGAEAWNKPDQAAALMLVAQPARMLFRRGFVQSAGLRWDEGLPWLAGDALHWRACLRAASVAFHEGAMAHVPDPCGDEPGAEARGAVFALCRDLLAEAGPEAAPALRNWLARRVGRDLAALPLDDYWRYAEAAAPVRLGGDWPAGRGGRALAALATHPLWQAVALWQAEALWPDHPPADPPSDWPRPQATSRAIALWRGWRAGSDGA